MAKRTNADDSKPGFLGVFQTLANEHREVSALLDELKADPANRSTLWPTIRAQLLSHDRGEVREVYPVLRANDATRPLADLHDRDAKRLETMILELDYIPLDAAPWLELFTELADAVVEHATDEETNMFPKAQEALGAALADQMNGKFVIAKQQLLESV